MRDCVFISPFLGAELLLEEVRVENDSRPEQISKVGWLARFFSGQVLGKKRHILFDHQGDERAGGPYQTALLLNYLVRVSATVHVMVNNSPYFAAKVALLPVQNVVVDQGHLFNCLGVRELRSELIVKVQIVLTYLAIRKVLCDLKVGEEVCAIAVDDGHPLLAQFLLVVKCKHKRADSRIDIATCVSYDDS